MALVPMLGMISPGAFEEEQAAHSEAEARGRHSREALRYFRANA